jgi:membrane-associated phospholipid phosphatase
LLWHFLAIVLTYIIVTSDFDWYYYLSSQKPLLRTFFSLAMELGMIVPVVAPLTLLATGGLRKDVIIKRTAFALG